MAAIQPTHTLAKHPCAMTHLVLQLGARLHIVGFGHVSILRLRQAVSVSFPIRQPWELIQQHKRLGDHVLGQKL